MVSRGRRYDELGESMREHLAERIDALVGEGVPRAEAEFRAKREFGNVTRIEEQSREVWQWPRVESIWADVKYAMRQLLKSPGFTATAVVTLGLGIAVNATMFSMVSAFLMPRLPGHDAKHVVVVSSVNPNSSFLPDVSPVSVPNYDAWRDDTRIFGEMAAGTDDRAGSLAGATTNTGGATTKTVGQAEAIQYESVSPNYFGIFGASPQLGRGFVPGEDQPGHDHVLILSHGLWARRFGGDPGIVGTTVRLNREDYTVVGVMGDDFRLLGFAPQLWTPLTLTATDRAPDARKNRWLFVFARLASGVTLDQARAEMRGIAQRAGTEHPETEKRWGAAVRMLPDYLIHAFSIAAALTVLMATVGFVLLIACANVAALLLTRAAARQKELAIRAALGASRARVMRQLLTEGVVIAMLGGSAGLLLTLVGIRLLGASLTFNAAIAAIPLTLDMRVLIFAVTISVVSAVLSSLAPALKASRTQINTDLKSEGRAMTAGRSHNRLRATLVGGEIAMALFLLIGSGLLIHGIYQLDHQKLGFRQDHLLTAGIALDAARYQSPAQQLDFLREVMPRLKELPGVEDAAVASSLPAGGPARVEMRVSGQPELPPSEQQTVRDVKATADYLRVAGIALERGRAFTEQDNADAPRVVLVNQEFVRRYFKDRDPLGKQIALDAKGNAPAWSAIVGVVNDVLAYSQGTKAEPVAYESLLQRPVPKLELMLRTSVDPNQGIPALRAAVAQVDPDLPLIDAMSMEEVIELQRSGNPLFTELLVTFGSLALLLAAIGIYGLIAYSVSQRTQEIGIRLALGAKGSDISRLILRQGLFVAAIGSAIGLLLAAPLPTVFKAMFDGIEVGALGVYPGVLAAMLIVVLLATLAPARRASRVDPVRALRSE